jgi:2'-5' RNA ligase
MEKLKVLMIRGTKMRLFIAVNFNEEIKDELYKTICRLRENSLNGNFTRRENLHLTLAFLGETVKLDAVKQAMDGVNAEPFLFSIRGLGKFQREGSDLFWIGVEKNEALFSVYTHLWTELSKVGFQPETRAFKPHLTLGREVTVTDQFQMTELEKTIAPMKMNVRKLSLMRSERIQGKLTYTEIYSKQLAGTGESF